MQNFLKNLNNSTLSIVSIIIGCILILGALGKLGVLQGILNTIMIILGIIFLLWGINKSNLINIVKNGIKKNPEQTEKNKSKK